MSRQTGRVRAPELEGGRGWLNTGAPLSLAALRGKVVLVDFWTYSCINCIRTVPHVQAWHERYARDGLVVVGVHTPEFAFERDPANVRRAVADFGITYPVAIDNGWAIWRASARLAGLRLASGLLDPPLLREPDGRLVRPRASIVPAWVPRWRRLRFCLD